MDEITTAVIHIKQLYTENLRQLKVYKKIQNNGLVNFDSQLALLKNQKESFCKILKNELKKLEDLGVKVLIHENKLPKFLKKKLKSNNQNLVLIALTHLERSLYSEYKCSLSVLNPKSNLYDVLLAQKNTLENSTEILENSKNEIVEKSKAVA